MISGFAQSFRESAEHFTLELFQDFGAADLFPLLHGRDFGSVVACERVRKRVLRDFGFIVVDFDFFRECKRSGE